MPPRCRHVLLTSLAFCSTVGAQGATRLIGIEGGATRAGFSGSDAADADSRTGPFVGLTFLRQRAGRHFGVMTGVGYVAKGASLNFGGVSGGIKLGYIELPVLARFALPLQGSRIVPALLGGASLAFNTSCRVEAKSSGISASADCDQNIGEGPTANVRTFDFGLTGGVEVSIPVSPRAFLVPGFRYTRGLMNVGTGSDPGDTKNSAFQFGIALRVQR